MLSSRAKSASCGPTLLWVNSWHSVRNHDRERSSVDIPEENTMCFFFLSLSLIELHARVHRQNFFVSIKHMHTCGILQLGGEISHVEEKRPSTVEGLKGVLFVVRSLYFACLALGSISSFSWFVCPALAGSLPSLCTTVQCPSPGSSHTKFTASTGRPTTFLNKFAIRSLKKILFLISFSFSPLSFILLFVSA